MEKRMPVIGKAWLKDENEITQWITSKEAEKYRTENWSKVSASDWESGEQINFNELSRKMPGVYDALKHGTEGGSWLKKLLEQDEYNKRMEQCFDLIYLDEKERFVMIRSSEGEWILPARFAKWEVFKNYDDVSVSRLSSISSSGSSLMMASGDVSKTDIQNQIQKKEEEIETARQQLANIQEETEKRLAEFRRQLEEEYRRQNEIIAEKKAELEAKVEELNNQIYMLDTQIYAIRCMTGEVVNFTKLTNGQSADINAPLVIYQKLRFLDEELGKLIALYDFDGEDCGCFEDLLKHRRDMGGLFCPGDKSVSFVKVSRSGTGYCTSDRFENMLESYEKYHGHTIGILVRDGDNLYIGWTDEDRIRISDDNMYYEPKKETITQETEYAASTTREEKIARFFIISILQGLINEGKLIRLPEEVKVMQPNPYVVFSMADGWLEDNTYGTWVDILKATAGEMKKGDMVLTIQYITRDDAYSSAGTQFQRYNNDRGRGDKNRTHDVSIANSTVYPINLVETDATYTVSYLCYPYDCKNEKVPITDTSWTVNHHFMELAGPPELKEEEITLEAGKFYPDFYPYAKDRLTEENVKKWVIWKNKYYRNDSISYEPRAFTDEYKCYKKVVHDVKYKQSDPHYYISEEKSDCAATWDSSKKMARANMEVFKDEFLNLTYLDSVRIRYAITNRKLGGWKIGRRAVDYAKAIKYLNVALSYVLNREEEEKNMLLEHMEVLPENWQVTLAEWRHENSYHRLTPARAKSFVELVKSKNK